jgi:diguanylate cyclase (GGDEF)-like protein
MATPGHWSAQQLAEFLAVVSSASHEDTALAGAVERAAEALEAEVAAVVEDGRVVASVGFPRNHSTHELIQAAEGDRTTIDVPGAGPCAVLRATVDAATGAVFVFARSGSEHFEQQEVGLAEGMARVLGLTLHLHRLVDQERGLRTESQEQAQERAQLLQVLGERQALLERLFKIQRSISHRAPIESVLDAITAGAAELLGDPLVGLRLIDESDPNFMVLVSAVGIDRAMENGLLRSPITEGVGGQAAVENRVVVMADYLHTPGAISQFVADGLRAAMAAPVHRNGEVVGSLVVGSYDESRRYSETEQDVLLAFAEHASLALNDASAVDAMRRAFGEAMHQATHDALTGLPNRSLVLDRLAQALARAERHQQDVAVIFVDLDRFKAVNDTMGHRVGDRVLETVATRLHEVVRPSDTVGRLAGDEFVIVCDDIADDIDVVHLAQRIGAVLAEPMDLDGREVVITASLGIAHAAGSREAAHQAATAGAGATLSEERAAEDLLRDADVAMYRAKELGRSRLEVFDEALRVRLTERLDTEHSLRRAIQRWEFVLHYQPTVDVVSGRIVSVEALIRWHHPERGLVSPAEFVHLAEETGLIVPIGGWALGEACHQMAYWRREHPELSDLRVSVNLSARQFGDAELVPSVAAVLEASQLPPESLWLEITESVLMDEAECTVETLRELRDLGVHLAIDDFGTGYSSLSYLKRFPVDVLKIDRSFVDGLGEDSEDQAIVTAVIGMAHALGLRVVAEGVERELQLSELRRLHCDGAQGFLLGRPQPASDTLAVLCREAADAGDASRLDNCPAVATHA